MSVLKRRSLGTLILACLGLLSAAAWISFHGSRMAKVPKELNQAKQLLGQAAAAPWSRTDRNLATLQQYVRDNPSSARNRTLLGTAYLQKARESGDPSYLGKAEELFKKALELDGK